MRSPLPTLAAVVATLLLFACAASSWQAVPRPRPDDPLPEGRARVVVVRTFGGLGSLREVRIWDGEQEIGVLGEDGWIAWDRSARRGVGRAVFEGYVVDGGPVESLFDLPRDAGTTTWAVLSLQGGDLKPTARVVSAEEGRKLIEEREPAEVRR